MTERSVAADVHDAAAREFDAHRRFLWGLCYRMTGSAADADDLMQEAFVRALERPPAGERSGWRAWLVRVAINLSIDTLRRRRRREYVGPWLPAPIETGDEASPHQVPLPAESTERHYDLIESVSMAFLLALEELTPRQRAVLILRDVFDYTVQETAKALGLTQANVKVTHHRARHAMNAYDQQRVRPTREYQGRTAERLREFLTHLQNRDVGGVEAMLAADARLLSDSGGEFVAATKPVIGRANVAKLLFKISERRGPTARLSFRMLNGSPAVVADSPAPTGWAQRFVVRIDLDAAGNINAVHTILNTRKLSGVHLGPP